MEMNMKSIMIVAGLVVCAVGGMSFSAASPEASLGVPPYGAETFIPSPEAPIGFRADGNGWYPGATPPVEWWEGPPTQSGVPITGNNSGFDPANVKTSKVWVAQSGPSKNILWKAPMPGWGDVQPIVVGKRVITAVDPDVVLCFDADSGKLLWQDRLKLMTLPVLSKDRAAISQPKQSGEDWQYAWELCRAFYLLGVQINNGSQHFKEVDGDWATFAKRVSARVEDWRKALPTTLPRELDAGLERYQKKIEDLITVPDKATRGKMWMQEGGDPGLGRRNPFTDAFSRAVGGVTIDICWQGHVGGAFSTPVSDGQTVVACFAYGQIGAYEVATGKRLWAFRDPLVPGCQYMNHGASPWMYGDLVLIRSGDGQAIMGLEKKTGAMRWETQIQMQGRGRGANHGNYITPVLMDIPDGKGGMRRVLVTQEPPVLDAVTGEILGRLEIKGKKPRSDRGTMVGRDGILFTGWGYDASPSPTYGFRLALADGKLAIGLLPNLKGGQTGASALTFRPGVLVGMHGWLSDPTTGLQLFHTGSGADGDHPRGGEGSPGTLCGDLMISCLGPNSFNRQRGDLNIVSPFWVTDVHDPLRPRLLSSRNLLGTADLPADLIFDTYLKGFDKKVNIGCYKGIAPWLGCRVGGVVAKGNRLYIQTSIGLYCIGPEALGSAQDDPAVVKTITAATAPATLQPYLAGTRPRYRREAVLKLAALKAPLTNEIRAVVEKLLVEDPFEEVRAAALAVLDAADATKRPGSARVLAEVAAGLKAYQWHVEESKSQLRNAVLTVRAMGVEAKPWLAERFEAVTESAPLGALYHLAYTLDVEIPKATDRALAVLAEPKPDGNLAGRCTTYLAHTGHRDPRTLPALRQSTASDLHVLEALCMRTPAAELDSTLDHIMRNKRIENHLWPIVSRGLQRLGVEKAAPLLAKLATDKPDLAKKCEELTRQLRTPEVDPRPEAQVAEETKKK